MMDFRFHLVHAVLPQCQWNVSTTMGIYLWRAVHAFTRKDTLCVLSMFFCFFPFFPPFFPPASYEQTATTVITTTVQVSSILFTMVSTSHEKHMRSTPSVKSVNNVDSETEWWLPFLAFVHNIKKMSDHYQRFAFSLQAQAIFFMS